MPPSPCCSTQCDALMANRAAPEPYVAFRGCPIHPTGPHSAATNPGGGSPTISLSVDRINASKMSGTSKPGGGSEAMKPAVPRCAFSVARRSSVSSMFGRSPGLNEIVCVWSIAKCSNPASRS